jgi:extracellular elastinolytic metalloproteinase
MGRELDTRTRVTREPTTARQAELRAVASAISDELEGAHRVRITRFDDGTGNPTAVASDGAPAAAGNYVQRALEHVARIRPALGLTAAQPAEFVPDPHVQRTSSGAAAVHLHQHFKGIPIFQAAETVRFAPDGTIKQTAGRSVSVSGDTPSEPRLSSRAAVVKACQHVAVPHADEHGTTDQFGEPVPLLEVDVSDFEPEVIATFPEHAEQTTVFAPGPFGDKITAGLIWFALNGDLRLSWEVVVTMPEAQGQYRVLVDAKSGEILYCHQLMHMAAGRGNVFQVDGAGQRQMIDFPRPLADYGVPVPNDLPAGFPDDWVEMDRTAGNCVRAHLQVTGPTLQGVQQNGRVVFDPADPDGADQMALNIFYYNGFMHDFFYLLGFREADGNFQQDNLGRGGTPSDRVDARAHPQPVFGTANMATPRDGFSPIMNMGLVASTGRHTAFDSSVVFHEFMHGVTNRLVGGRMDARALEEPQSGGMGEGWGDYFACSINGTTVVGDWVVDRPGGIRGFPYNSNFPDNFGDLGTGRYFGVHNIGEIWCATLLEVNRTIGRNLAMQLVVDALKLAPTNPGFLDMRDAILDALDDMRDAGQLSQQEHADARDGIWTVFARFGMGPNAASNGAGLTGIVADFTAPPATEPETIVASSEPDLAIPDNDPAGVADQLAVAQAGTIAGLTVAVDIRHTWIGDLIVSLTAPGGTTAVLHNRSGGPADDLVRSYSSDNLLALAPLIGGAAQGTWTLHVADKAGFDLGTLRRWSLEITPQANA